MLEGRIYMCIDLKSFYASVECVERGLDPMTANLVVADPERSDKTICLAISPSMKAKGISNRCRVFEIPKSISYIMAVPRMKLYIEYSANIYSIYLKYIAKEDIHVYSIDEAFMDVTDYLSLYQMSAQELAVRIMEDIRHSTGITATAGIGTNLYLAKIALDITAKYAEDNIGYLDEMQYQKKLWKHKPLTDFWRIGTGIQKRLSMMGITTMEEIAKTEERLLYHMFGVDAELLIDHAWGREPVTMEDIKQYRPDTTSMSSGQVLPRDYNDEECLLIVKEMTDALCLDMAEQNLVTDSVSLMIGYTNTLHLKPDRGTVSLPFCTNAYHVIVPHVIQLYQQTIRGGTPIRRLSLSFKQVRDEAYQQYDLFTDPAELERDRKLQRAALEIKRKFGQNALVRGMDLQEAATAMERNRQIGGHKSGE